MRTILIIAGRYLPGYRDGGPVRSLINLAQWLGDEYDIRIYCLDRDHGDQVPYPGISYGNYEQVGRAKVWYTQDHTAAEMEKLAAQADVVYVAGLYDRYARLAMKLHKAGKIKAPVYVAPMGSFSPEAFRIKGYKKRLFVSYMKFTGMFDNITWSVTSSREEEELKAVIGRNCKCIIAADLPRQGVTEHTHVKEAGSLKLCFVSRISRKKNLEAVSAILKLTDEGNRIKLDIYGIPEDREYLRECMDKLDGVRRMHPDCHWEYKGEAESEKVPQIFADYDAFLFPTLGENYGHVIAESLAAGCIPIISDTTPWLDFNENGCGYVCPLSDLSAFARAVDTLSSMTEDELAPLRTRCYEYISRINEISVSDSGYRRIFG